MKLLSPVACLAFFLFFLQRAEAQASVRVGPKPSPAAVNALSSAGYNGTGSNIDVIYQKCEWTIDPTVAKKITGTVTITFTTIQAAVSTVSFDLNKTAFNNASLSVKYLGSTVPFSFPTTGVNLNILRITLPSALAINTTASVVITYSGTPPAVSGMAEGYQRNQDAAGNWYIYTLSESYEDRDWWPCKADMQDKIDQMDIWIKVPNGYRAATNGAFVDSSTVASGFRTFKYQTKYPIASYLVAVGVAKYYVYTQSPVNISGTNVPVWYWIYPDKTSATYTTIQSRLNRSKTQLLNFSTKFGDYAFKNEKHGYYEFGWGGGMEHQSFSAMGASSLTSWSVIAHELAHQWFGDKVTFATWNHLWLAEGFAKYGEALTAELDASIGVTAASHRVGIKSTALSTSTTPVYLSNASIANSNTLWTTANDNAAYQRGAMVVSMLRRLAGDTKFFQAVQNYLADPALAYKSATTENLRDHFETVLSYDLDAFFTDYIYGTGNPAYDVSWGNSGNGINIELTTQRRSGGTGMPYFRTPVVLKIFNSGKTKDTSVVIYDQNGQLSFAGNGISLPHPGKILGYNLSFTPASVEVDPDAETMVRGQDGTLIGTNRVAASTVTKASRLNYPPTIVVTLPVKIVDFKALRKKDATVLSLLTAPTEEKITITAERSEDRSHFFSIGEMVRATAFDKGIEYNLEDKTISNAHTCYYRAKTIDEKGLVNYSKVVRLKSSMEMESGVSIRPTTITDNLKIFLSEGWEHEPVAITVFNNAGMIVKQEKYNPFSNVQIPVQRLPAGNYSLQITRTDGKTIHERFIIVR